MDNKDRYLLLSIAKNKGIDVCELKTSYNYNSFGLVPVLIDKESVDFFLKNNKYNIVFKDFSKMSN